MTLSFWSGTGVNVTMTSKFLNNVPYLGSWTAITPFILKRSYCYSVHIVMCKSNDSFIGTSNYYYLLLNCLNNTFFITVLASLSMPSERTTSATFIFIFYNNYFSTAKILQHHLYFSGCRLSLSQLLITFILQLHLILNYTSLKNS